MCNNHSLNRGCRLMRICHVQQPYLEQGLRLDGGIYRMCLKIIKVSSKSLKALLRWIIPVKPKSCI